MTVPAETATFVPGAGEPALFHLACVDRAAGSDARGDAPDQAWVEPLLRQNAVWFCRLRWTVVVVLGLTGFVALVPGISESSGLRLTSGVPLTAATLLALLNFGFVRLAGQPPEARLGLAVSTQLWAQSVVDLLVLTAVIHWLGSAFTPAPFMYLFHVILACMVFTPRASLGVVGFAAALYVSLLLLEGMGVLKATGVFGASGPARVLADASGNTLWRVGSVLWLWTVIWYLVSRLAAALRARDRALYLSNVRLAASIEERSQHMLQTTHQLKAPFAAIHAQTQLLLGGYCGVLPDRVATVVGKISERCLVLSRQIQEMLQLANLRSQGQSSPPAREVRLEELIESVIARLEPAAQPRGITVERHLDPVRLSAVSDHLTMLVENLVLNAVTYSRPQGVVQVSCSGAEGGGARLTVADRGIGIPREKLPHIFEDYYRTEEAVQHNRSSTGLGLAIVRQVACQDGMDVRVESAPGWGSRFTVVIPASPRTRHPTAAPEGPVFGSLKHPVIT